MSGLKNEWDKDGKYYPHWGESFRGSDVIPDYSTNADDNQYSFFETHCNPTALIFDGPALLKPDKLKTDDNFSDPTAIGDPISFAYMKGNIPRKPTQAEFNSIAYVFESNPRQIQFPGLINKCWWVSEDTGTSAYNCMGYCTAKIKIENNYTSNQELQLGISEYFKDITDLTYGYTLMEELGLVKVETATADEVIKDPNARVAIFSGGHVAIRSWYQNAGERLWESKIGAYGANSQKIRILHSLKDLENGYYANVISYYKFP